MTEGPRVERIRHELKRRRLTVARVERQPAHMIRVVLTGPELEGFVSAGFDDHVKLFIPGKDPLAPAMRDFTPRRFDASAQELWIDFFVHDAGPAASWAAQVTAGQTLEIGGPKGSAMIAVEDIDSHVLVGDETALPAIARRLEELPRAAHAWAVVEVAAGVERPVFAGPHSLEVAWAERSEHAPTAPGQNLIDALRRTPLPTGRTHVWVATESRAARAIRAYLRTERGLAKDWIKAAGYWQAGKAGAHERIADDE